MWVLFQVPCPTSDGQTAVDLYQKRVRMITSQMKADAVAKGCRFHRAWHASDGSAFYAVAEWATREGARSFFDTWDIRDEPGEFAVYLEGDVGLVPVPDLR